MIRKETIDRVRAESDIVAIIGEFLPLKKVGKYYRGVCPFHPDKSPSFYVSPERQVYHCFGCGAGGSVVTFMMQHEKVDFPEAVRLLAKRLNIEVRTERTSTKYQALYDACEFAARFFEQQLPRYSAAVNYLLRRGMKDETVRRYRLGYAPGGSVLRNAARTAGLRETDLKEAGLLIEREHGVSDWFFGRVIFPIMNLSGRVIGFSGRVLDDSEPKYLNTNETPIFRKGENLYGLFQAKNYLRREPPILVEGNFDLLALANRGINCAIAPLGTAFTPEQASLIKRFNSRVRIMFDSDTAGRNATRRVLEILLRGGLEPGVVLLPAGNDPDDYVQANGVERLRELLQAPVDLVSFMLDLRPAETVAEKNAVLREILQLVAVIPDTVARELHLNRVSEAFGVAKDALLARVKAVLQDSAPPRTPAGASVPRPRFGRAEQLLALAAINPECGRIARELLPPETFDDPELVTLATRLFAQGDDTTWGLARLSDALDDEALRRRVAGWEFQNLSLPSAVEYRRAVQALRSRWLCAAIARAEQQGDLVTAERLRTEHFALRKRLLQQGE
ncbi:MAG: DNA primase [candidate division WOR-3 bacterium]